MKFTVFYSWQSDSSKTTNQDFIQEAARLAIHRLASESELEVEPVLDRDTQNVPGAPVIAESILEKIDHCGIFLCDITLITEKGASRASPNPNVLIELGYAMARIGWDRIVHVMNAYHGGPSKLPFDLQHRRWPIDYRLSPNADCAKIEEEKERLSKALEEAFRSIVQSGTLVPTINPKDRRVAMHMATALGHLIGNLAVFLRANGYEDCMMIIGKDIEDAPGSEYPSVDVIEPILEVLARSSFAAPSPLQVGDRVLTWTEMFAGDAARTAQDCNRILDQHADRDEALISLVDGIHTKANNLAMVLSTMATVPEFKNFYANGVPDVHMIFFSDFLLAALKSYRVIRQFGFPVG